MSRPVGTTKQFCKRGHDTDVVGRYANNSCKGCCQIRDRSSRPYKRARALREAGVAVSAAPIRALGSRQTLVDAWVVYRDCTERTAERKVAWLYSVRVISIFEADELCCALGTHLAIVFPALYREAVPA